MSQDIEMKFRLNLPLMPSTMGYSVLDTKALTEPYYLQDDGLKHTSFCQSSICFIDGDKGQLLYRGYPIEQLAKIHDYTQIVYLLLHGELATDQQILSFREKIASYQNLPDYCYTMLENLPHSSHPMGTLLVLVGALASDEAQLENDDINTCIKIIAQMPLLVAMSQRHSLGLKPIKSPAQANYVEHFLHCLHDKPSDTLACEVFDKILTLHAEHEQNASTCTLRVSGSTGNNPYASLAAAITALWGPLHGGANEACMLMLEEIQTCDRIPLYIDKAKSKNDSFRLMGFGHRVYKNQDPRAEIMKSLAKRVLDSKQDKPLFKLARSLEKIALEDPYFISHKLYPNVDYYSGIVQRALGVPNNAFTTVFALARTAGWMAHWLEMKSESGPIIRPRQHYVGQKKRNLF